MVLEIEISCEELVQKRLWFTYKSTAIQASAEEGYSIKFPIALMSIQVLQHYVWHSTLIWKNTARTVKAHMGRVF